jgi:hypothetical protein
VLVDLVKKLRVVATPSPAATDGAITGKVTATFSVMEVRPETISLS